jgi:hypothetical protein
MEWWLFFAFHIASFLFCYFSTRSTFHYLSKHRLAAKTRFLLFGFLKTRYVAVFYLSSISLLTIYSLTMSLYLFLTDSL